jgi:hypothetical protein
MADTNGAADVHVALAKAQGEFPPIHRSRTATVRPKEGAAYTYNYADLGDILAAVRPVLSKHGISVSQPIEMLDSGRMVLRTLVAFGESAIDATMPLPPYDKPQSWGSALTYARRYSLTSLLGLATEDDDDGEAAQAPPPSHRQSRQQPVEDIYPPQIRPPSPELAGGTGTFPERHVNQALHAIGTPMREMVTIVGADGKPFCTTSILAEASAAYRKAKLQNPRLVAEKNLGALRTMAKHASPDAAKIIRDEIAATEALLEGSSA